MSIRDKPTYLSFDVWRALYLIAKATPETDRETINSGRKTASPDEIADNILRQHIQQHYPQLFEHHKKIEQMEKEIVKSLSK